MYDPAYNYNYIYHYEEIKREIERSGYEPKTSMENLIKMVVLDFDRPENYGDYNPSDDTGGYGYDFTMDGLLQYVDDCNGWQEFDFYC